MENVNEQSVLERTRELYQPNQVAEEIDLAEAVILGRGLSETGFRMMAGTAIRHGLGQTVEQLLHQLDYSQRYQQYIEIHPESVVGPHFIQLAESEFCPHGIGVWVPNDEQL